MRWPFVRRWRFEKATALLQDEQVALAGAEHLFFEVQQDYTKRIAELEEAGIKLISYMYRDASLTDKKLIGVRRADYDALVKVCCPPPERKI